MKKSKTGQDPTGTQQGQDPTEAGSTGEGAASALARMKVQLERRQLREPAPNPSEKDPGSNS